MYNEDINLLRKEFEVVVLDNAMMITKLDICFKINFKKDDFDMEVIQYKTLKPENMCHQDRTDDIYNFSGEKIILAPREYRGLHDFIDRAIGYLELCL